MQSTMYQRVPTSRSLEDYLDHVAVRGRSWCLIELANCSGFRVAHGKEVHIHAVLEGRVRLTGTTGEPLDLLPGDVAVMITGDTHKMRSGAGSTAVTVDHLTADSTADSAGWCKVGLGATKSRVLSGRLQVTWPDGSQPARLPNVLRVSTPALGLDLARVVRAADEPGSRALLDQAAAMLLVESLRSQPYCRAQFRLNLQDPVSRAMVLIERHPFEPWSVRSLAERVGMGRSNFAARFAAQIGKTPIDALTEERLKYAQHFLRDTDLKIAEIGELVGYRTEAAFIRRFAKHLRTTPSKMRKLETPRMQ